MSDYSYSTSHSRSLSRSNEWSYIHHHSNRHASDHIPSEPSEQCQRPPRHRRNSAKKSSGDAKWNGLPTAPFPPTQSTTLPFHPHAAPPPAPQPPSRGRLSQPSTPPRPLNGNRVNSAPIPPIYPTRLDYQAPRSPSHLSYQRPRSPARPPVRDDSPPYEAFPSYPTSSPRRPNSSGHDSVNKRITKSRRNSDRSARSSPKQKRFSYPPPGYTLTSIISREEALDLLANGALEFQGKTHQWPHTEDRAHRFYADIFLGIGEERIANDKAPAIDLALKDASMTFMNPEDGWLVDMSLEYPNMLYAYGRSPGTTTLNWFVGQRSDLRTPLDYKDSRVKKRKVKLINILERLGQLEEEGLSDSLEEQYSTLYDKLLEDPEQHTNPHYECHLQIIDLMKVLMNREWIDFSIPKNQVVAKFFDSPDAKIKTRFFHQLLLAAELYLRIQSPIHMDNSKRKLLEMIPCKVQWDLALAQRWLENMLSVQLELGDEEFQFNFKLTKKSRQIIALRNFARALKWPNLEELEYVLKESNLHDTPIEDRSADTMSWFSAVILPGPTLPFLIMNALIDCDEDTDGKLGYLTHVKPNSGFQYRANTYWSYKCILGKVLGASRGVKQVGGWVGPCHYAPELERTQCVTIRTKPNPAEKAGKHLTRDDVEDMCLNSHPLGAVPHDASEDEGDVCLDDFEVPEPPNPFVEGADVLIRIQKLRFKPIRPDDGTPSKKSQPSQLYDAKVVFAIHGRNVPMRLRYDVDFVCAPQCANGPHALWKGYKTRTVRVEESLHDLNGWGTIAKRGSKSLIPVEKSMTLARRLAAEEKGLYCNSVDEDFDDWSELDFNDTASHSRSPRSRRALPPPTAPEPPPAGMRNSSTSLTYIDESDDMTSSPSKALTAYKSEAHTQVISAAEQRDTTLLIDATGVSDNEVFARAWCAHWGANAVICNVRETCIACAVREARAACIEVVVLTEGGRDAEKDQGVWDLASEMS